LDGSRVILSPKKTIIGFLERQMVGHIVSKNGVVTDPKKLPFPITKKTFRNFSGMVGYYQRFIHVCGKHMFAANTCSLTRFLQEDALTPMEDEASKHAFEQPKSALQAALIF
jgi:hypothetical protein